MPFIGNDDDDNDNHNDADNYYQTSTNNNNLSEWMLIDACGFFLFDLAFDSDSDSDSIAIRGEFVVLFLNDNYCWQLNRTQEPTQWITHESGNDNETAGNEIEN